VTAVTVLTGIELPLEEELFFEEQGGALKRPSMQEVARAALAQAESQAIRRKLRVNPGKFWRAVHGRMFLVLGSDERQLEFDFEAGERVGHTS